LLVRYLKRRRAFGGDTVRGLGSYTGDWTT